MGLALPWRPWSPAPEPREVFWSGAEILGFPPATMGEAASADCSDMLDRLDARDAARLSSTSPSSDSNEIPRWCCARGPGSRPEEKHKIRNNMQGSVSPGVVWRETLLSFRNWSRKDIWEEGRSPSTEEETVNNQWASLKIGKSNYWEVSGLHRAGRGVRG